MLTALLDFANLLDMDNVNRDQPTPTGAVTQEQKMDMILEQVINRIDSKGESLAEAIEAVVGRYDQAVADAFIGKKPAAQEFHIIVHFATSSQPTYVGKITVASPDDYLAAKARAEKAARGYLSDAKGVWIEYPNGDRTENMVGRR